MTENQEKSKTKLDYTEFFKIQEEILQQKLKIVRKTIKYSGEKGRNLELVVKDLLRAYIPQKYGIDTGFIVWLEKKDENQNPEYIEVVEPETGNPVIIPSYNKCNFKIEISTQQDLII